MKKAIILSVLTAMSLGIAGCGEKNTVSSGVSGSVFENSAVISDKEETTAKETQLTSVSAEQTVTDANQPAAEASAEENTDYESIKPFVGLWRYQVPQNSYVYVDGKECGDVVIYEDATYKYTDPDGNVTTGTVKHRYDEIGGTKIQILTFSGDSFGSHDGYYLESAPYELRFGNGNSSRLARDRAGMTYSEIAAERLGSFNDLNNTFCHGVPHSEEVAFTEDDSEYYKVTDFSMVPSLNVLKDVINTQFTGKYKDQLMSGCEIRFMEKDGVIYELDGAGTTYEIKPSGFEISVVDENQFNATHVEVNTIRSKSYGTVVFIKENGEWKMSDFISDEQ